MARRRSGEIWMQDLYDDSVNNVALRDGDALIAERDRRVFPALGAINHPSTVLFAARDLSANAHWGWSGD